MDYELIAKALFESFENIYDVNLETSAFSSFHESEAFRKLQLDQSGADFFAVLPEQIEEVVAPSDRKYVRKMLTRDNLVNGLNENKYYSFVYRLMQGDREVYHQLRATYQPMDDGMHIFMGVRNIDDMMRQEQLHQKELSAMQQQKEQEKERLEDELRMSRIRNFTSQMQPHFLYNTLGSIQEVMLMDPEYASELLGDFTVHLRSCIHAMVKDEPLAFSQELENVRAYINIERMRFGNKLRVHYDIQTTGFSILPLTIQPIVENAIRHGIYGRGVDGGDVCIRSYEDRNDWVVQIEDNGIGFDTDKYQEQQISGESDSTALKNVEYRLDKVMKSQLRIESKIGEGTIVTVRIPKGESYEGNNS